MKTKKILAAAAGSILLSMTLLTGCGDNSREKALEDQVSQLEQQVTDLQNAQNSDGSAAEAPTAGAAKERDDTDNTNDTTDDAGDTAKSSLPDTQNVPSLEELTQSVSATADKVNGTTPSGTPEEQLAQYRTLKQELDSIDRDLDYWDDDIEHQFEQGLLTREEYQTKDREIDALEDQLDNCEDILERLFGIDD